MPESTHTYELIAILNPGLDDAGLVAVNERVAGWITGNGGKVSSTNVWGKRQLAYMIRKQTQGFYVQFNYEMPSGASRQLDRSLRIDESVVRHLIIRLDEE